MIGGVYERQAIAVCRPHFEIGQCLGVTYTHMRYSLVTVINQATPINCSYSARIASHFEQYLSRITTMCRDADLISVSETTCIQCRASQDLSVKQEDHGAFALDVCWT